MGCIAQSNLVISPTVPVEEYGPWSEKGHGPEADFLAKIKAIDGVSQVETQTITNVQI